MKAYAFPVLAAMLFAGPVQALEGWTNRLAYKLSVPGDYDPKSEKRHPTVVHYHGYGGPKSPTNDPKNCGSVFGSLWKKQREGIIGIFPQWDGRGWGGAEVSHLLIEILDYEKTQLRIDEDRIYLTGQSVGGYGSYFTVTHYPRTFAAVVPISGEWGPFGKGRGIAVPRDLTRWKHLPYWAAHGMRDHVVPYKDGKATVERMREGGIYVRFTAYPKAGHHVKQLFYANQKLFNWLLAQKRGTPHNYEWAVDDGNGTRILGFFEPKTVHDIEARAPAKATGEVFTGWTSACGTAVEHTTTQLSKGRGRFANAKALTTTFTMPANDVIVTATYGAATPTRPSEARR